jgi:hypothetical protein
VRGARALAQRLAADIATASRAAGAAVTIDGVAALDRGDAVALAPPGLWSPNRSCRLVRAVDGWIAVNLARPADVELVPRVREASPTSCCRRACSACRYRK